MKLDAIQSEHLAQIVHISPWPVIVCDQNKRVQYLNQAACDLLQVQKDAVLLCKAGEIFAGIDAAFESETALIEVRVGPVGLSLECRSSFLAVGSDRWTVLFLRNAGEKSQREMVLEQLATTDELSGLANRRGFQRHLEANLAGELAIAIIDIDHFKAINDQRGHMVGDDVIVEVGRRISELFVDFCIVAARTGGDEFGVLCHSCDSEKMVQRLKLLQTGLAELQQEFHATLSIGAAISQVAGLPTRELLTRADQCLYQAKAAGRNELKWEAVLESA